MFMPHGNVSSAGDPKSGCKQEGDSAPLLHACEIPPWVLHPALGSPAQEGSVGVSQEEGHR